MAAKRKTAVHKRDSAPEPSVQFIAESKTAAFPVGNMLIASPLTLEAVVRNIPQGSVLTLTALRDMLAVKYKADYTCPLTTGIFLRVVAEAALEEGSDTPYWRVVRPDGRLIEKLPGGEEAQARRLSQDGVTCKPAGNGWKVSDLASVLWRPRTI